MEVKVNGSGDYRIVSWIDTISDEVHDMLNEEECKALAKHLEGVVDELTEGWV